MEASIIPQRTFTLLIRGREFKHMQVTGEWEGFLRLESPTEGRAIVADTRGSAARWGDEVFPKIFGGTGQQDGFVVLKASGRIKEWINIDPPPCVVADAGTTKPTGEGNA